MALSKYRIGDLITPVDERNTIGLTRFYGVNINKEFMPTVASTDNLDERKYKIVRKGRFVYSGMQTGRDECIRISMFTGEEPVIVSPAYTTFEVTATDKVNPTFFFMIFQSKEKDRFGAFCSDGSIRANLDWEVFCDFVLELPSLPIQEKYVQIYTSMIANRDAYARGLQDLKFTCDAYIEDLRRRLPAIPIGPYIRECDEKNEDGGITLAQGVTVDMVFTPPKRVADDIYSARIVRTGQIAYNRVMKANGTKMPIALRYGPDCVVSGSYQVFEVSKPDKLLPEYLMLWLRRSETQRKAGFLAWGSTRDIFSYEQMAEVEIPIPKIEIQESIVAIFKAYNARETILDTLNARLAGLVAILIRGATKEGAQA